MNEELFPFNLEEALKNPDRVVYRNGTKPLEWHLFEKSGIIVSTDYFHNTYKHGEIGIAYGLEFIQSNLNNSDLLLLPLPEKQYWANVYKGKHWPQIGEAFESEEEAKKEVIFTDDYIKTISFTL